MGAERMTISSSIGRIVSSENVTNLPRDPGTGIKTAHENKFRLRDSAGNESYVISRLDGAPGDVIIRLRGDNDLTAEMNVNTGQRHYSFASLNVLIFFLGFALIFFFFVGFIILGWHIFSVGGKTKKWRVAASSEFDRIIAQPGFGSLV